MNLAFDIETVSLAEQDLPFFPSYWDEKVGTPPEFTSRFTADVEKREADIQAKIRKWKQEEEQRLIQRRIDFMDNCALSPDFGRIAAIGVAESGFGKETEIFKRFDGQDDEDEASIIRWLLTCLEEIHEEGGMVATFNGFGFDYPFLYWRAIINGISPNRIKAAGIRFSGKWGLQLGDNVFDLMKIVQCRPFAGQRADLKYDSLGQVCKALGIGEKLGDGKDFSLLSQEDKESYLQRDMELTVGLAKRLLPMF